MTAREHAQKLTPRRHTWASQRNRLQKTRGIIVCRVVSAEHLAAVRRFLFRVGRNAIVTSELPNSTTAGRGKSPYYSVLFTDTAGCVRDLSVVDDGRGQRRTDTGSIKRTQRSETVEDGTTPVRTTNRTTVPKIPRTEPRRLLPFQIAVC